MKCPADVRLQLQRRFAQQHRTWIDAPAAEGNWPAVIPLGIPTEAQALQQPDAVRAWADEWRAWRGAGTVVWIERQWRALGTQRLPSSIVLQGPADVADWAGQSARWLRAQQRGGTLLERWPALRLVLGRLFDVLADYADDDYVRLVATVAWLRAHPCSGFYLRQLPIAGLDSKWIESRRSAVAQLIASEHVRAGDGLDFYALCGLRKPAPQLRIRILDPVLRAKVGGLGDVTAPVSEVAALDLAPRHVLVVENLQTGLALEDLEGTVVIMGLGYGVNTLAALPWVHGARCWYWGDIDTHGFAILSAARSTVPQLESILMDEDTLLTHQALWSIEPGQHGAHELPGLTAPEANLYTHLKNHSFGQAVRLEQERIDWPLAWSLVQAHLRKNT